MADTIPQDGMADAHAIAAISGAVAGDIRDAVDFLRQLVACKTESQNRENPAFRAEALRCRDLVAGELAAFGIELHQ